MVLLVQLRVRVLENFSHKNHFVLRLIFRICEKCSYSCLVTLCQCYIANRKAWTPANRPRFVCLDDSFSSYECKQKVLEGNLKWYSREHMNDKKKKKQSSLITDMEKVLAVLIEDQASHSIP